MEPTSRPTEFARENCKTEGNHHKSRTGQKNHGDAYEEDKPADHSNQQTPDRRRESVKAKDASQSVRQIFDRSCVHLPVNFAHRSERPYGEKSYERSLGVTRIVNGEL